MQESTVLVTGATSGIGSYLVQHFLEKNWIVLAHGRSEDALRSLKSFDKHDRLTTFCADMRSESDLEKIFLNIRKAFPHIDLLVSNAFGKLEEELVNASPSDIYDFFAVSLAGTAEFIRQSVPLLSAAEDGCVINIIADWGFPMHNIMTGPSLYIAGKYGVHGLGVALQKELADQGIRVTNIFPGIVAATFDYHGTSEQFAKEFGDSAIHPKVIASALDFVLAQKQSLVRSVVLSPRDKGYNGL